MAKRITSDHIHRYQREVLGKDYVVYKCVLPGCNHYLPERLVVGKLCLCNRCKIEAFIIKKEADGKIRHKPHCEACTRGRVGKIVKKEKVKTFIEELLK